MRWVDCAVEAPPDECVLICDEYGDICFGAYNASQSQMKGCELPNPHRRAVWLVNSSEGRRTITHWARLYLPSMQANSGDDVRDRLKALLARCETAEAEARAVRKALEALIGQL